MPPATTRPPDPRGIVVDKRSGGEPSGNVALSQRLEYRKATAGRLTELS